MIAKDRRSVMARARDDATGDESGIGIDRCKSGDYMTDDYSTVIMG